MFCITVLLAGFSVSVGLRRHEEKQLIYKKFFNFFKVISPKKAGYFLRIVEIFILKFLFFITSCTKMARKTMTSNWLDLQNTTVLMVTTNWSSQTINLIHDTIFVFSLTATGMGKYYVVQWAYIHNMHVHKPAVKTFCHNKICKCWVAIF